MLIVACCLLLVNVACRFGVCGWSLCAVGCRAMCSFVRCVLSVDCCLLLVVRNWSSVAVRCALRFVRCVLLVACCSLFVVR